jgi:hypothetical protein
MPGDDPAFIDDPSLVLDYTEYRELIEADRKQADASKPKPAKKLVTKQERTLVAK